MQCDVGSIPGYFDKPAEAKVDKIKAKCGTWQGDGIFIDIETVMIFAKDVYLI